MAELAEHLDWLARLAMALACGAVVGLERELSGKRAGLRTNMLVALGAAVYTLSATHLAADPGGAEAHVDPSRIIAGIAGGIGFLGAGTILQARGSVHGLTTAAAIWVAGAVGVAAGFGYFLTAAATAASTVFVLWIVRHMERAVARRFGAGRKG